MSAAAKASGASRRLFYAPATTATVFENSAVRIRRDLVTLGSRGLKEPCHPQLDRGDNFEHKLEVIDLPLRRQTNFTESLILAQDERWRRAKHMQVERDPTLRRGEKRRTGEYHVGNLPSTSG